MNVLHKDCFVFTQDHERIAQKAFIWAYDNGEKTLGIFGKPGTGKSEVALITQRKFHEIGLPCHIMHLDRYYLTEPDEREIVRKNTGIIGPAEINITKVEADMKKFVSHGRFYLIIVEGLYASYFGCNNYMYIDVSDTYAFRQMRGKENPDDEWRKYVVEKENAFIETDKHKADLILS